MNKLYEVLEICLNELEQGTDVDTILFSYPEFADELRPILDASVNARQMAVPAPSQEVIRRNRAKLLQHASAMRERNAAPISRRIWSVPLRRALVTLMVSAMLFVSGTGLVRAASTTLPGDNLYPVKRTWEDLRLLFTFDPEKREVLEFEHENERLEELNELFAEGRTAKVDFAGYVSRQNGTEWRVSGITVYLSSETRLPGQQVIIGAAVRVRGQFQDGSVLAERIELLPAGSRLPEVEDHESEIEEEDAEGAKPEIEEDSGSGPVVGATVVPKKPTSTPEFEPEDVSVQGVVTSVKNNLIVVNGIVMDIRSAEIKGLPSTGVIAKVEGYYDISGVFIVIKIEFRNDGSSGGLNNDNGIDDDNDNDNDANSNGDDSNDNDDNGDNDSGGNSGPGGGGDD